MIMMLRLLLLLHWVTVDVQGDGSSFPATRPVSPASPQRAGTLPPNAPIYSPPAPVLPVPPFPHKECVRWTHHSQSWRVSFPLPGQLESEHLVSPDAPNPEPARLQEL